MGQPVPADDLPGNLVPASDLPDSSPAPKAAPVTVTPPPSLNEIDPGKGLVETAGSLASGMVAQPLGGYAGLVGTMLPGPSGQGADWAERVSSALTYNPHTTTGKRLTSVASAPGRLYEKYVTEPIGERGAKASPSLGAIGKGSAAVLPMLLGARSALKQRTLTAEQQRAAELRDKGYRLTPEEMGSGPVAKTTASLAGEPRLAKLTTAKNQAKVVEDVKAELGIPPNVELNLDSLGAARKAAHREYEAIRQAGDIPTDSTYMAEADAIGQQYRSAAKSFPKLAKTDVENLTEGLKVEKFNASEAIDQIQLLRQEADEFFRKGETRLAKANRSAADMIEAQIGRHLEKTGQKDLLTNYQAARQKIAKTYSVQKAVVGDDSINPQKLGQQVKEGKPLTGKLKEVGKAANDFERSFQKPTHQATGATIHDAGLAMLNALRSGGGSLPLDILSIGARPAVRSFLASRLGQWLIDPRTNLRVPEAAGVATVPPQNGEEKRP